MAEVKTPSSTEHAADDKTVEYGSIRMFEGPAVPQGKRFRCIPVWVVNELKEVFNLSWTMIICTLLYASLAPVSLIFVGKLGTKYLDAVGLGNTIMNIFGMSVFNGLTTACDTVFSQSYGGSNKKMIGVYLQRSTMIISLALLPCFVLHLNTETLLRLIGQDPEIARLTGEYCLYMMPQAFFFLVYVMSIKWLRNQNMIYPTIWTGAIGVAVNALAHYLFIDIAKLGIAGSAMAQDVAFFTMALASILYILCSKIYRETWGGFTAESFQDWSQFTSLALAGLVMIWLQWMGFEIGTILTGLLDEVQLGAQTILFQVEVVTYMIPISVGIACNIRVGQLLGANNPWLARRSMLLGFLLVWAFGLVIIIILLSLRWYIPMIFSSDEAVIETAAGIIPILALYHLFDGTCGTTNGILRGCGRQNIAALIIFIATYFIGMPIGLPLMFLTDLKSAGFWWGLTIALFIQAIAFFTVVFKTDWETQALAAQVRAGIKIEGANENDRESGYTSTDENNQEYESHERTALISKPAGTTSQLPKKKYCSEYASSQHDVHLLGKLRGSKRLSTSQLIFRRSLTLIIFIGVFCVGLFCRLYFNNEIIINSSNLCIPYNASLLPDSLNLTNILPANQSLPVCNSTL